ncbi:hypothetical protein B0H17DRAFT_628842 [Mycena rosella]|uniref:Zn(2)-C6 fungal-type domain-containing protein n=1 Tax=Mycena rosella TaxID=1033263 RepID=A0AAD7GW05_MYCRO|nr:hypothetical protein B0H17DRAFT_628842 [Mycena rosella]
MSRNPSQPPSMSRTSSQPPARVSCTPSDTLSRPFRSRKNRPCDGCRRAKSRCAIPQSGPPCVECQQMNKECTFDQLPPERKKPRPPPSPTTNVASASSHLTIDSPSPGNVKRPRSPEDGSAALQALSYAAAQEKRMRIGESEPISLDLSISRALDPHVITTLLTDDLLPIGTRQAGPEDTPLSDTAGYIRQISCDRSKPQYIIFTKRRTESNVSSGQKQLAVLKTCLSLLNPPPSEDSLIDIYLGLSNPAFPLVFLPPDERPLDSLHSKLCLTALNHYRHYRSSIMSIRSITHASAEDTTQDPSRLSNISAALLDLSARPVLDAEANYLLLARVRPLKPFLICSLSACRLSLRHSSWAYMSIQPAGLFHHGKKICVVPCGRQSFHTFTRPRRCHSPLQFPSCPR